MFFINGPGGTGKTFVESLPMAHIRSQGQVALAVASSGIASILLEGGRTSHSRFTIPLDVRRALGNHLLNLCSKRSCKASADDEIDRMGRSPCPASSLFRSC
jgi:PIF1-like helicase